MKHINNFTWKRFGGHSTTIWLLRSHVRSHVRDTSTIDDRAGLGRSTTMFEPKRRITVTGHIRNIFKKLSAMNDRIIISVLDDIRWSCMVWFLAHRPWQGDSFQWCFLHVYMCITSIGDIDKQQQHWRYVSISMPTTGTTTRGIDCHGLYHRGIDCHFLNPRYMLWRIAIYSYRITIPLVP